MKAKAKKIEVKVYVTTQNRRNRLKAYNQTCCVGAAVPAKIKQLLIKEADTQGLNLSAMIGQALVMYLQDCGTKIEA